MNLEALAPLGLVALLLGAGCKARAQAPAADAPADTIRLPAPRARGPLSLEEALAKRRSVRQWAPGALRLDEISQLVWAGQGLTGPGGKRTAPSAMARYPIELYVVANAVEGLPSGAYHYSPAGHALLPHSAGDHRAAVAGAAGGQTSVATAPAVLVVAAVPARFGGGSRPDPQTDRFIGLEAGAVLQNLYLQATALHLGAVAVGGFDGTALARALPLPAGTRPMIIVPVGRRP